MRIEALYSHLNGQEHILVHQPDIWREIDDVIRAVDAETCRLVIFPATWGVSRELR